MHANLISVKSRGFIKGRALGKLTGCERNLAINLPGCFCLLFLLSFLRKTKNAWLKNPTDLLHKNLMKPLEIIDIFTCEDIVSFLSICYHTSDFYIIISLLYGTQVMLALNFLAFKDIEQIHSL